MDDDERVCACARSQREPECLPSVGSEARAAPRAKPAVSDFTVSRGPPPERVMSRLDKRITFVVFLSVRRVSCPVQLRQNQMLSPRLADVSKSGGAAPSPGCREPA